MANAEREYPYGFQDKRRSPGTTASILANNNYVSVANMRTALATAGYASPTLDLMTRNDMVYALRLVQDATGI